jgi:hypothetical protein
MWLAAIPVEIVDSSKDWVDYAMLAATWFAAIGTVAAVWLALRRSRQAQKKSLKMRTMLSSSGLQVIIHNDGPRALTVRDVRYKDERGESITGGWIGPDLTTGGPGPLPAYLLEGESVEVALPRKEEAYLIEVIDTAGESFHGYANPFMNGMAVRQVPKPPVRWAPKLSRLDRVRLRLFARIRKRRL